MDSTIPTTDSMMYQTMHQQPAVVRRLLDEGWSPAAQAAEMLVDATRVLVVGIGTSYHAALMGSWFLRSAGADARAIHSYDFANYPHNFAIGEGDAAIIMSHSGVKTYSQIALERAKEAGARVLSVGSLTAEHPGSELILRTTEREKSAAFTASHMGAMAVMAQVATELGERNGTPATEGFRAAMEAIPDQIQSMLDRQSEVTPVALRAAGRRNYATGAGPNEYSAIEAVIKVREAAYGWIDALGLEQFLHGPIVSFNAGDGAIVINVSGASEQRVNEVAVMLAGAGGDLWIVGKPVDGVADARTFAVPETVEDLSPLLTVVPMQMLAYEMAVVKGVHPDTFRRDQPKWSQAMSHLKL